jgi:hypothetical protein
MRPWGTLRLTIRIRSCGAIACIRCSVAAPACPCTSWSGQPMPMMPALPVPCSNWPCISPTCIPASSGWMLPLGVCNACTGSTLPWEPLPWFLGIRSDKRTAPACRQRGPKTNWACRRSIERFFGRVFLFFRLQRPPSSGWATIVRQVALTSTASIVVALAAWQAHRSDLIRSPKRVLAHLWEDSEL